MKESISKDWNKIETAPTKGEEYILLRIPFAVPQLARAKTWWVGGHSAECKPTHWMPVKGTLSSKELYEMQDKYSEEDTQWPARFTGH